MNRTIGCVLALACSLCGCEVDVLPLARDAGQLPAKPDAGIAAMDAGAVVPLPDAGALRPDAGSAGADAGLGSPDAGPVPPDAGPSCDSVSCAGCCDASGNCQGGDSSGACGSGGASCQDCAGKTCASGSCPATCAPANCSGCCASDNSCQPGTDGYLCGAEGQACQHCASAYCYAHGGCSPPDPGCSVPACACLGNWNNAASVTWLCNGAPAVFTHDASMASGVYENLQINTTNPGSPVYYLDLCSWRTDAARFQVGTGTGQPFMTIVWTSMWGEYECLISGSAWYDPTTDTLWKMTDDTDPFWGQTALVCGC